MIPQHGTVEISRSRLAHNLRLVRSRVGKAGICATIKANAYGHGVDLVAGMLRDEGVEWACVYSLQEVMDLARFCPLKLLVLGFSLPADLFSGVSAAALGRYWRRTLTKAVAGREIVRTLSHDIEEKKLRVEVSGDSLDVEADEQSLRQVLFNLVINAIQAVAENGRIQIVVQRTNAGEAALEVRDDGPGVSPENRKHIIWLDSTWTMSKSPSPRRASSSRCIASEWRALRWNEERPASDAI